MPHEVILPDLATERYIPLHFALSRDEEDFLSLPPTELVAEAPIGAEIHVLDTETFQVFEVKLVTRLGAEITRRTITPEEASYVYRVASLHVP